MSRPPRPCLTCGALTTNGTRCARCPKPTRAGYTNTERQRRALLVQQWRSQYGDVCPGWDRGAHAVTAPNVLTADHVHAVARGGQQTGPLAVLCRSCNSSKADRR